MSVAPAEDLVGAEVGRYRLERVLGEGGMGRVYLGIEVELGTRVAIKVLSQQTPETVQRFFAEARAVSLMSHFNIVNLVDLAELEDGRPYMVMELVEGQSLRDAAPTMTISQIAKIIGEVLAALEAAHAIGIVHRDLKPDNIMVTKAGHAKVLDFGVAKLAPGVGGGLTPRTKEGLTMGTPAYMAPEQVIGSTIDARTDVYTMGVVLFEAVTGRRPFMGGSDLDVMRAHRDRLPPRPRTLVPGLPAAIEDVILRALAKEPAKRYASAHEMAAALEDAVAGRPSAREVTPSPEPVEEAAPHSRLPAMIAVAVIAVAATVVFGIARHRRNARHVAPAELHDAAVLEPDAAPDAPIVDAAPADAGQDAPLVDAPPLDAPAPDAAVAEVKPRPAPLPGPVTRALDVAEKFDPIAYLKTATALAHELAPDAKLVELLATPVTSANVVELSRTRRRVEYVYVSKADARACLVIVAVAPSGATARLTSDRRCDLQPVAAPRCTLAQVRAKTDLAYTYESDRDMDLTIVWRGAWVVHGRVDGDDSRIELPDC